MFFGRPKTAMWPMLRDCRTNVLLSDKHHVRCEGCDVNCNLRSVYLEAIVMLARDTLNFALLIQQARVNSCASRVRI